MNVSQGFQPVEWTDFSGGFTDNIYSDDVTKCAKNDNLLIDRNRKTYLRPGSNLFYPTAPQHPNGNARIGRFMKFPDETSLFAQSGTKIAYDTGSAWTALTGAGSHDAFPGITTANNVSWAYWNNQYFMANDGGAPVVRIYKDSGGTWRLIQAGLPPLDATQYSVSQSTALANAITLANALRIQATNHFTDTTTHTSATVPTHRASDTVSNGLVAGAASDLATLLTLTTSLLQAYQNHHNDSQASSTYHYVEIAESAWGQSGTPYAAPPAPVATVAARTLANTEPPTILVDAISALNDLKKCYNTHEGRVDIHGDPFNVYINPVTTSFVYGVVQGPCIQLDPTKIYTYANNIKAIYNAHIAAATTAAFNHVTADTTNTVATANATTPETLEALVWRIYLAYPAHQVDAEKGATWSYHRGKENPFHELVPDTSTSYSSPPFPDEWGGIRAGNWSDSIAILNQMKRIMNAHFNDTLAHKISSGPTPNPFQIPGGQDLALADYGYAFHYKYKFTVGTIQNELVGPVLEVLAENVISTEFQALAITNIPTLANATNGNYDTANVTVEIYRTTDGGNTFYFVGSIANGTGTFTDFVTDEELVGRETIYINGGVVDYDPVPISNCVHITNSTAYYGGIIDTGESFPNRVRQSIQGAPDACPGDFFDDLEDAVVGISSVKTVPIVGCVHSFYRLDGAFTETGTGLITHQAISSTVGLVSEASLVRVDNGVFFAGTDGFYFTDGYNLTKLSDSWNTTYASMVSTTAKAKRIVGTYDSLTRRVWWTCQLISSNTENDSFVILDLNFDFSKPCWSTASNKNHFAPTAAMFYLHALVRGHSQGYIFQHVNGLTTDPYINTNTTPANWGTKSMRFDWRSTFICWGMTNVRKWCPLLEFNLQNDSNINVQANGFNDNDRSNHVFQPLKSHDHYVWGDETLVWGDKLLLWNFHGNLDIKRYVPAGSLRCTYKSVEFTNALVTIQTSQDKGTATVGALSGGQRTVTLDTGSKYWPLDPEGHNLVLASGSFEIVAKNSTTLPTVLTIADPSNLAAAGSQTWSIQGFAKGQAFHLLDFTLWGKPMSLSQTGNRAE